MNEKQIEDFIDLMFNFDFKELENEKTILEYLDKLQKETKQLKAELKLYKDNEEYLNNKIDKAIEYIKTTDKWLCRVNDNLCVETIGKDKLLEILGDKEND